METLNHNTRVTAVWIRFGMLGRYMGLHETLEEAREAAWNHLQGMKSTPFYDTWEFDALEYYWKLQRDNPYAKHDGKLASGEEWSFEIDTGPLHRVAVVSQLKQAQIGLPGGFIGVLRALQAAE